MTPREEGSPVIRARAPAGWDQNEPASHEAEEDQGAPCNVPNLSRDQSTTVEMCRTLPADFT